MIIVGNLYHCGAVPTTRAPRSGHKDPLSQISSLAEANRYTYVGGNPINLTDPLALCADPTGFLCKVGNKIDQSKQWLLGHPYVTATCSVYAGVWRVAR